MAVDDSLKNPLHSIHLGTIDPIQYDFRNMSTNHEMVHQDKSYFHEPFVILYVMFVMRTYNFKHKLRT